MKKVGDYRKILGVVKATELKEVKSIYRGLMKDWHPDKFANNAEKQEEAEQKSKEIIEAYNFLLSIAPETLAHGKEEYLQTTGTCGIADFEYKNQILRIDFFEVSRNLGASNNLFLFRNTAPSVPPGNSLRLGPSLPYLSFGLKSSHPVLVHPPQSLDIFMQNGL